MSSNITPSLRALDELIASVGLPVRTETLEEAWARTAEAPMSRGSQDRVRRLLQPREAAAREEVTILVTLRARPERVSELERAAREFVDATMKLEGAISSTLYKSSSEPHTLILLERFVGQEAFTRHMASDYFRRFQIVQEPLLASPVEAVFLERIGD